MAVTFASATCQSAVDNLGQTMIDAVTAVVATSGNQTTVLTTDLGTEVTRILALSDSTVVGTLDSAWITEQRTAAVGGLIAGQLATYINNATYTALLQHGPFTAWDALDFICSQTAAANTGLSTFMVANNILCDQYSADSFNQFAASVASGGYVRKYGTTVPVTTIPTTSVFPHTNVDTINLWTTTGAATGTLAAGTASLAKIAGGLVVPAGGVVEAYAGNTIGGQTYTLTVTYTSIAGVAAQTYTLVVATGVSANTVFVPTPNPGPTIASIQSVAITSGTGVNGDICKFRLKPVRAIAA